MKPLYIALDTETTGLDPAKNTIVELAAIALDDKLQPRNEDDVYQTLVKPWEGADIHPRALEVNGHYWCQDPESDAYKKAVSYPAAWNGFLEYMVKHFGPEPKWIIMIGWNPSFDEGFLRAMHARAFDLNMSIDDLPSPAAAYNVETWPFHYHKLDYLSICRYLDIRAGRTRRTYKLERIAGHYFGDAMVKMAEHTALGDTQLAIKTLAAVENDVRRDVSL
ncbi:MAG: 3'-5' exonuclease [Planctomycetota bacterium]|jgi:DNA polymerase III epsilon subunit-like protein